MGLIRLITFLLVAWVVWSMYRKYQRAMGASARGKSLPNKTFVKCVYCDVHLPEAEAVKEGNDWFCSRKHQQAYLEQND